MMTTLKSNLSAITQKIKTYYNLESIISSLHNNLENGETDFLSKFLLKEKDAEGELSNDEQLLLTIALLPYIDPYFFKEINEQIKSKDIKPGFLFYQDPNTGSLLPLLQTALLIIHGESGWEYSLKAAEVLKSKLFLNGILELTPLSSNEQKNNRLLGLLSVNDHYLEAIFSNSSVKYQLSSGFPAKNITTLLKWDDLILDEETMTQVNDILSWEQNKKMILDDWGLKTIIKPGYKALFYGPSGTGKTLTATLLGQKLNMDVYRVDLSLVVSKFIGETEKNLSGLFNIAEKKDWILFFDEADSLFGNRTELKTSNDRYANQEVSYLLQRIEDFDGIVILASNLKSNIDKAFSRRFQSVIKFKLPDFFQRKKLWEQSISKETPLEEGLKLEELAQQYELSGGSIINVVQYATLKASESRNETADHKKILHKADMIKGIACELLKDGKTLN